MQYTLKDMENVLSNIDRAIREEMPKEMEAPRFNVVHNQDNNEPNQLGFYHPRFHAIVVRLYLNEYDMKQVGHLIETLLHEWRHAAQKELSCEKFESSVSAFEDNLVSYKNAWHERDANKIAREVVKDLIQDKVDFRKLFSF